MRRNSESGRAGLPRSQKGKATQQRRPTQLKEDAPPYTAAVCDRRAGEEENRRSQSAATKLRFIDLFCGIGGFRYAFERAGGQCVFSSDWNPQAQITCEANHGERPHGDIHTVAVADNPG